MKAVVVTELGKPPVLQDVAEPERGDGEALLEILAAPINPVDLGVAHPDHLPSSPRPRTSHRTRLLPAHRVFHRGRRTALVRSGSHLPAKIGANNCRRYCLLQRLDSRE